MDWYASVVRGIAAIRVVVTGGAVGAARKALSTKVGCLEDLAAGAGAPQRGGSGWENPARAARRRPVTTQAVRSRNSLTARLLDVLSRGT